MLPVHFKFKKFTKLKISLEKKKKAHATVRIRTNDRADYYRQCMGMLHMIANFPLQI